MRWIVDISMLTHQFHHVRKENDLFDVSERCLHKLETVRGYALDRVFDDQPHEFYAVFDNPERKLFRTDLYPEYKAGRTKHEDLPETEAATLCAVQNDADWKEVVARDGYEADDEMASLAHGHEGKSVVYSIDSDCHAFLQAGRVVILKKANVTLGGGLDLQWFTERDLLRKFGIVSESWSEYMTMVGGKDNVPGWYGVGEKKAIELVRSCVPLDQIDVNDPPVKLNKTQRNSYEEFRERYPVLKKVRTIVCDLPMLETVG